LAYPAGDEDWYILKNVDLGGYNILLKAGI
jgi:hypothetical protein